MGDVVVITGASAGIGRATARRFARDGASIGLIARGEERLRETAREVEQLGGRALVLPADVADPDALEEAAQAVEEAFGPIDIWINNAMATVFAPALEVTPAEFRRATEVTYHGTVWGTLVAMRRMKERDHGTIVQVGSALAYRGIPLQAPYCGAKHAVQGFTESVRTELMHDGSQVHITMVQLPAHNTPQFEWGRSKMSRHPQPVPPIFQPEVAADAIHWAAHNRRRELYVGLPTLMAIFGNRVAAWYVDRKLAKSGYDDQQTDELVAPGRADNLFESVSGDYGAHGSFDRRAKDTSVQLWLTLHKRALAAGATALAVAAAAPAILRRR